MAKSPRSDSKAEAPRRGYARSAGEIASGRVPRTRPVGDLVSDIAGVSFKRFGFVQGAVVSRWAEIVGERYARVSTPESIRFPGGKKAGGTLTLSVEGAHAPLMQHLGPMIIERVNRFFGYEAIASIAFRQGRAPRPAARPLRSVPVPVPRELGEGLRQIADPELRLCLESLAASLAGSTGRPAVEPIPPLTTPVPIRSE